MCVCARGCVVRGKSQITILEKEKHIRGKCWKELSVFDEDDRQHRDTGDIQESLVLIR